MSQTLTEWVPGDRLLDNPGGTTRPLFQIIPDNAQMCYCSDEDDDFVCGSDAARWKPTGDGSLGGLSYRNDYGYEPNTNTNLERLAWLRQRDNER